MKESEIQREVIALARKHHKVAWLSRANSGVIKSGKRFIHLHPKGTPDVIGFTTCGKFIGIEIKKPSTKKDATVEQVKMQELMSGSNCVNGLVYDIETLNELLDSI